MEDDNDDDEILVALDSISSAALLVSLTSALRAAARFSRLALFSAISSISASKSLSRALLSLARLAAAELKSSTASSASLDHLREGLAGSSSASVSNLGRRRKARSASSRALRALLVSEANLSSMDSLVTWRRAFKRFVVEATSLANSSPRRRRGREMRWPRMSKTVSSSSLKKVSSFKDGRGRRVVGWRSKSESYSPRPRAPWREPARSRVPGKEGIVGIGY